MKRIAKRLLLATFLILTALCFAACTSDEDDHHHTFGEWSEDTATCESVGRRTRTCTTCTHVQKEDTPALGHDLSEFTGNTATCTEAGIKTATCKRGCGHVEEKVTAALGHSINSYGECSVCNKRDIIVLIENGKANFNVIVTSQSGGSGMASADAFVSTLRELKVSVNDPFMDTDPDGYAEYEIIIGGGAAARGEACNVSERELGIAGTVVKIVGNKIIIAASTPTLTRNAIDKFVTEHLGITSSTKKLTYLEADSSCCYNIQSAYQIDSISIAGNDLADYEYVIDVSQASLYGISDITGFHTSLFNLSGYYLKYASSSNMTPDGKYFIIRYVDNAGEEGFRAYVDGDDLIVECAYKNAFNSAFLKFANEIFYSATGDVAIASDFSYTDIVSIVYYEDFGADGTDELCDFEAIFNAHVFANQCGQKVMSRGGSDATYHISPELFTETVNVKTNVDFCGATFIINDVGEAAYKYRRKALFTLARDNPDYKLTDSENNVPVLDADGNPVYDTDGTPKMTTDGIIDIEELKDVTFKIGDNDFSWLAPYLTSKSLVKIENKLHKDFIRHGSNQNSGATRRDLFVVNPDGTVEGDTLPVFDFDNISTIEIYRADDTPITVENGNFINICCRTVASTQYVVNGADSDPKNDVVTSYANKFHEYLRGFLVYRTNATIKNVTHKMENEPELGWYLEESNYAPDGKHASFGSRHESYPYYGFVLIQHTYNFTLQDSQLTGHTTYYEDKPATASTGWKIPDPVPMGTYDYVIEYSSNITFDGVIQVDKAEQLESAKKGDFSYLADERYWGIMSSNGTKNLNFLGCAINRFDAHRGFWNATLKDTYIGHSFQVIGGGTLYVENVTKASKTNFLTFRGDYGATFNGDIILKDCTHEARNRYNSSTGYNAATSTVYLISSGFNTSNSGYSDSDKSGAYWLWDFGYTCYMPKTVTIDNFTSKATNTYVFNNLPNTIFEKTYVEGVEPTKNTVRYPYQITERIIQKNMPKVIKNCGSTNAKYSKINSIPVTKENIG